MKTMKDFENKYNFESGEGHKKQVIQNLKNLRVLAIDDSSRIGDSDFCFLIGILYRNGIIEGAVSTQIKYDGSDSTKKIEEMIKRSRFAKQIQLILLHSITVGGLNIVNISELSRSLNIPVIALTRHKPHVSELENAVSTRWKEDKATLEEKLKSIRMAGEPFKIKSKPVLYAQVAGIDRFKTQEIIKEIGIEPIRISHIIASSLSAGESKGRF